MTRSSPPAPVAPIAAAPVIDTPRIAEAKAPSPRHAVLLVGGGDGDDAAVREHLTRRGFALRVVADEAATTADAHDEDLILISQSVIAKNVRGKFAAEHAPIICWECGMWDDLGLARGGAQAVHGVDSIRIDAPTHPLAAGLIGTVRVSDGPATLSAIDADIPRAHVVASIAGSPALSALVAFDAGDQLADGTHAPGKRVGFFLYDQGAARVTPAGWQLLDAAIDWCVGETRKSDF